MMDINWIRSEVSAHKTISELWREHHDFLGDKNEMPIVSMCGYVKHCETLLQHIDKQAELIMDLRNEVYRLGGKVDSDE